MTAADMKHMQPPPFVKPKPWLTLLIVLLAAAVFDTLFYEHHIGLNLALFTAFMVVTLIARSPWNVISVPARITLAGTLLAACMVYVHHSGLAVFMTFLSLFTSAALVHEQRLRSLPFALPQIMANYLTLPLAAWEGVGSLMRHRSSTRTGWRWGRIAILPLIIAIVFFQLYRVGNPKFETLTAGFLNGLWDAVGDLLEFLFTRHVFFFLFAMALCAGLLYRFAPQVVVQVEQRLNDALIRTRLKRLHWQAPRAMDPLERERRMGIVLLVIANVMLVVVNVIDIDWVWFGFEVPKDFSLKQFVHEGTWTLIASIVLSMLVLLHLFRRNQNFYWRNTWLKRLALLWVAQNVVLCVSVFLRNYHYIAYHGLAYKRIGVIAFVVLVLVGL
ncbi:MAG TPA: DUF4173 domain-containing protein, partial [Flavobacteriales bacterium]|nr:DUF4173 domain-containing protein [Flavobacteriales bacterium]